MTTAHIGFRSFRARILTFVLGLLLVVQAATFLAVNSANIGNARRHINEALELTAVTLLRSIDARDQILLEKARLLSSDFAFKEASATRDPATILSAVENHRRRIAADVMMLLSMDGKVIADTMQTSADGEMFLIPSLLEAARESDFGEAASIEFLAGRPYQLVVVPLFTPEPSAWILVGFVIDDTLVTALRQETNTHISFVQKDLEQGWSSFASTLPAESRGLLPTRLAMQVRPLNKSFPISLADQEYVSLVCPISTVRKVRVAVVLQRSLEEALQPYMRLRTVLVVIFVLGIGLSVAGAILLASRVTRPVSVLMSGAQRIQAGDYEQPVTVKQRDELGMLASSFNHMMRGLAERDRVRNLLGKVVSPEIAHELLSKEIELGGEEQLVSVLFSDIRDFTPLAHKEAPQEVVSLLNTFLTRASAVIERHGGVVDKYIGDEVMALFGAPLQHDDDAQRAVAAALDLLCSLDDINRELTAKGKPALGIGIGVNSDVVVAGNMGSTTRLNYTVIGDGVNLAARLQGLTRRYGVGVIVSESTKEACPEIVFRELDQIRAKGRSEPVRIFEPLGAEHALSFEQVQGLKRHHQALEQFRARQWEEAHGLFQELNRSSPEALLYRLYLERIERFMADPPGPDWDRTETYQEK